MSEFYLHDVSKHIEENRFKEAQIIIIKIMMSRERDRERERSIEHCKNRALAEKQHHNKQIEKENRTKKQKNERNNCE